MLNYQRVVLYRPTLFIRYHSLPLYWPKNPPEITACWDQPSQERSGSTQKSLVKYDIWYILYDIIYIWYYIFDFIYIYICYYTYDILYMIYYIYMILYILYLSDRVSKQFDLVVIADTEVKLVWSFCQRMGYEWIGYINIKWLMKLGSQPCWTWVCRIFSSLLWQWEVECCSTRWIIFFDRVSIPTMVGDIGDICQIWMTFPMQKFGEG